MGRQKSNSKCSTKNQNVLCTLCQTRYTAQSLPNMLEDKMDLWLKCCVNALCEIFGFLTSSTDKYYRLLLQKGKFCEICMEVLRDLEISLRQVKLLEDKILTSAGLLKYQLRKGKTKLEDIREENIEECMESIEKIENETIFQSWYEENEEKSKVDAIFPAMFLYKIEKHKNDFFYGTRTLEIESAKVVDLISYKSIHSTSNEVAISSEASDTKLFTKQEYDDYSEEFSYPIASVEDYSNPASLEDTSEEYTSEKRDGTPPLPSSKSKTKKSSRNKKPVRHFTSSVNRVSRKRIRKKGSKPKKKFVERDPNRFPCNECNTTFEHEYQVDNHIRSRHFGIRQGYQCPFPDCDKKFTHASRLRKHMDSVHTEKKKVEEPGPFMCEVCGNVYENKISLRVHKANSKCKATTNAENELYKCTSCEYKLDDESSLKEHMEKHESYASTVPFKCVFCPEICKHSYSLKKHTRLFHSGREYVCKKCSAGFTTYATLKEHERLHENKEQNLKFVCHVCGHASNTLTEGKRHLAQNHAKKRHACKECDATYYTITNLMSHVQRKHSSNPPSFTCSRCGKSYKSISCLRMHEIIHSGRQFFCQFCNKGFPRPDYLDQHLKRGGCSKRVDQSQQGSTKTVSTSKKQSDKTAEVPDKTVENVKEKEKESVPVELSQQFSTVSHSFVNELTQNTGVVQNPNVYNNVTGPFGNPFPFGAPVYYS